MIVTCGEMKALEERAFAAGNSSEALMEDAGAQIAAAVEQFFPCPGKCDVFFGKGHNGGDALVAARHLAACGWQLQLHPAFAPSEWSELTARKHQELDQPDTRTNEEPSPWRPDRRPHVVLDGLLGIGGGGELREPIASAAREINRLRETGNAHVIALDLPTGVHGDSGEASAGAVIADFTFTIGFTKAGLLADSATRHVGRLAVLPLQDLPPAGSAFTASVATPHTLPPRPRRAFEVHKGDFGRIGVVAGSRGLTGAAILAAEAAVRAGGGLVTLYVTEDIHTVAAAATSPEVMVRPVNSYLDVLEIERDVLAIGPGLGQSRADEALELIRRFPKPMIIDADGLNILAENLDLLDECVGPRLLTPHPGEMARIDPKFRQHSRREAVEAFTARFPQAILLKGARTIIAQRGEPLSYNTTGSPGLSTGGMGDVLTGVCAALAGQKLGLYDAARLGSWLCGRAAELAVAGHDSEESVSPPVLLEHIGHAYKELRARCY
jgi:NAD(P)H-hydrate epimerase